MTRDLVIFGTGDMAAVIAVYLRAHAPELRIVGYTLDDAYCTAEVHEGLPLVPWSALEARFPPGAVDLLGPLTYQRMNTIRRDRYLEGKARGYGFARFIHPDCNVYTEEIGENCVILERNIIQPFARIGNNCILWSGNHIGHHVTIGDHVFIASQVGIAGSSVIGDGCHIAGQVGITHGLTIGADCALVNGAFVSRDLAPGSVVMGPSSEKKPFGSDKMRRLL
jgi:acetyltransferase-like isoleucine patch superfamily enzyme